MSTTLNHLLQMCEEQGVEVSVNGSDLDIFFDDYPSDELVELLRDNKQDLIDYLSGFNKRLEQGMKMLPVEVLNRDNSAYQLSFSQQRVWFVEQLEPGTAQFTMPGVFAVKGDMNATWVEQAFEIIVGRHSVLTTTYAKDSGGNPIQLMGKSNPFALTQLDFSLLAADEREQAVKEAIANNIQLVFDLTVDPMLKVTLIKRDDNDYLLLLALHHIAADGLSIGLLLKEFKTCYSALSSGQQPQLAPLDVQYVDYAAWQQSGFEQGLLAEQVQFWQQKLENLPLVHALPTDFERPQQASFSGGVCYQRIDSALLNQLDEMCSQTGVSRFTLLYSVFATLIARYSANQDVVIGTPAANRDRTEFENLIGLFVNSLVLRIDIAKEASFEQLLAAANTTVIEAQENKDLPFEVIVETLNPERHSAISPLFQLFFTMNQMEQDSIDGIDIEPLELSERIAKYDLTLSASSSTDEIKLAFEYSKALFKSGFIEQLASDFVQLLSAALSQPKVPMSQLQLLTDEQQAQVLSLTEPAKPVKVSEYALHQLIEARSKAQPTAPALACIDNQWDHQTLQNTVSVFADQLLNQGVKPGDKVALAVARNSAAVAWTLAILKVGAAYVPLDRSMPLPRLEYICNDAQVSCILADKQFGSDIRELKSKIIEADLVHYQDISAATVEQQWPQVNPESLAYVIYTSGSTGKPKGVKVSHQNVTAFIAAMSDKLKAQGDDTWLCVTPLAFDISVLETFGALSAGFKVVVSPDQRLRADDDVQSEEATLATLLAQHQVTHIQCTPSMATMLLGDGDIRAQLSGLKQILLGGEVLSESLAVQLRSFFNAEIHNMYGPTEATVWATTGKVVAGSDITIGKPLGHAKAYVVDENQRLLPQGAKGELMLAGPCIAQGYQTAPSGKREVFVENPMCSGEKAYLTGDLVRMNDDGSLQYLGRNDQQIKLRGFRIELADIDSHIESVPEVASAMAIVRGQSYEDKRIIAYFRLNVGVDEAQDWSGKIKAAIAETLPDYMMPNRLIAVDNIPMTVSGKKDRRYIGGDDVQQSQAEMVPPGNETEQILCNLWCDVLNLEQVGVCSNFFEMGGHSLLLTKLQTLANEQFALSLPIRTLFERNTIRAQAEIIDIYLLEAQSGLDEDMDDDEYEVEIETI